jgi:hypothetical protein
MRFGLALFAAFGVVSAALASAGCSSDTAAPAGGGGSSAADSSSGGESVSCLDDPRIDTYTAQLEKTGAHGVLTFELVSSEPAPPAKGSNTFEVLVTDVDGMPVSGNLGVELLMPDHGHGTQVPPVVTFDVDSNAYDVSPVYLFMPGVWRIELDYYGDAPVDADPVDRATFFFCIEG